MVRINELFHLINGIYWDYNLLILTFYHHFQDVQVYLVNLSNPTVDPMTLSTHFVVVFYDVFLHLKQTPSKVSIKGTKVNWLVVSIYFKHSSQIGSFPQVGVKIKHVWNHHLVKELQIWFDVLYLSWICFLGARKKLQNEIFPNGAERWCLFLPW